MLAVSFSGTISFWLMLTWKEALYRSICATGENPLPPSLKATLAPGAIVVLPDMVAVYTVLPTKSVTVHDTLTPLALLMP